MVLKTLWLEAVWSAEQEANFANVWLVQKQHQNAKQAHSKTTVRWSAVFEEVEVGLKAFWFKTFLFDLFD
jgi:hypothetical protein